MARPQKQIPADVNPRGWAKKTTDAVLADPDITPNDAGKLPREMLERLALICYFGEDLLRVQKEHGKTSAIDSLHAAFLAEFGWAIEFMARVRRKWYDERGAKGGQLVRVSGEKGRRPALGTQGTIRHFLAHPMFKAWEDEYRRKHNRAPLHKERAEFIGQMGIGWRVTEKQVQKVFEDFPSRPGAKGN